MNADLVRASEALFTIPPDLPREEWVRAGMAAQAAGLDFDTFNDWSAGASSYDARDARDAWRSFKPGKGIGAGTLFSMAADHGWRDHKTAQEPRKAQTQPKGNRAAAVWSRCKPVSEHSYVEAKQGIAEGLRVVPDGDPLTIAGHCVAGWLAVPAYGPGGDLQSLQFIPPPGQGKKLNMPGASVAGASFTVGTLAPGGVVYVVEGIGQAWACWKATGHPAIVAFGWGNVARVAANLRQRDNAARLVIVPDRGKEAAAEKIARDLSAAVAFMPQDEPDNFDANDYGQREGFDTLEHLLSQASEPPKPAPLLVPVSVADVLTNPSPPPIFVWDGYLPRGVVSLWGAHGGTGKSYMALMLATAVATGRPLFGIDTEAAPALFVSLEDGARTVRHRLAAICRAWCIDPLSLAGRLHIVDGTQNPELFAADHRDAGEVTPAYVELSKLVDGTQAGLVVVDNASDSFGGDEINRRQVRGFMRSLGLIAKLNDCAVTLLAHVDKNTSRNKRAEGGEGYSGSTAWHNSARSRIFMTGGAGEPLVLEHQKSNFGKKRDPLTLVWPEGGLPMLASDAPDVAGLIARAQGREDDNKAAALLALIAEFEGRGQYASPALTARNNVYALLRGEPAFQRLKLNRDAVARIVNQCQRAAWIEPLDYRSPDRKPRQRWTVTSKGLEFAGLFAPTAPTAPTCNVSATDEQGAGGAPTAPTCVGGVGERARTYEGALPAHPAETETP